VRARTRLRTQQLRRDGRVTLTTRLARAATRCPSARWSRWAGCAATW
jgi:hypothetical protein